MKIHFLRGFIAVFAVMAIALESGGTFASTAKVQNLMKGIKPHSVNVSGAITDDFINSTENFSVNLFKKTYKNGENTLVSPMSACLALGMTANGASGLTLTEFQNVLGRHGILTDELGDYGMPIGDLNKAYKAYADELTKKAGSTKLTISNSIWFNNGFTPNKAFLQNNADFFGAAAQKMDFADKNSVNVINNWVKSNTNNKIDKIIDKLSPDEIMHLINALYFEAKWRSPFDTQSNPYSSDFTLDNGGTSRATYMSLESQLNYIKDKDSTAVLLPYDDDRFAMLCILPAKGVNLNSYISSMSEKTISDLVGKMSKAEVALQLPQFKVTSDNNLNDSLKSMGLNTAFDSKNADFSKMGDDKKNLFISSVHQKTYLQVDELGTQAAAVTDIGINTSCNPSNLKRLKINRSFVYAIIDTKTNLPLFLGAMQKPESTLKPRIPASAGGRSR